MSKQIQEQWEEVHASKEWGKYPEICVVRFVARNFYSVEERGQVKILDFGCGSGANTWFLAREGFDAYAFDYSESAIARAEKRAKEEGWKAKFSVQDGKNLNYKEETFDAVIDNVAICHNSYEEKIQMYEMAYKIMKKDGKLLTVVFNKETEKELPTECYMYENEQEIIELLAKVGFRNIKVDYLKYSDNGECVSQYIVEAEK